MSNEKEELKKEFELERMVLFSDAVFAISITLLIIEIKFPDIEKGASPHAILVSFRPVIVRFICFLISFFFIGISWARHLKIFKYVQTYNNGVIFRNLLFLFFIVCFPFSVSGIEYMNPHFYLPFFIYFINIACIILAQFILCYYLFNNPSNLIVPGFEPEKKYVLLQYQFAAIAFSVTIFVMIIFCIIFGVSSEYPVYSFFILPVMIGIARRRLKKYKPAKQ